MLFKRAVFTTGNPVVLFLHAEKLGASFEARKCFPVFGPDLPWHETRIERPLAVCVGYRECQWKSLTQQELENLSPEEAEKRNNPNRIKEELIKLGFTNLYAEQKIKSNEGAISGAIIMANEKFREKLPKC